MNFLRKLFDTSKKDVDLLQPIIKQINDLEASVSPLTDDQLRSKALDFKTRAQSGESVDAMMAEVFAVVREVSKRTLGMRQFDVQMTGGAVLHQGRISEMKTGRDAMRTVATSRTVRTTNLASTTFATTWLSRKRTS